MACVVSSSSVVLCRPLSVVRRPLSLLLLFVVETKLRTKPASCLCQWQTRKDTPLRAFLSLKLLLAKLAKQLPSLRAAQSHVQGPAKATTNVMTAHLEADGFCCLREFSLMTPFLSLSDWLVRAQTWFQ